MASERNTSTARLAEIRGVHRAKCALDGSETADLLAMIEERDALLRNFVSELHAGAAWNTFSGMGVWWITHQIALSLEAASYWD